MARKSIADYAEDYTDPKLRFKLKEEIKEGSKGGKAGEWSARKSQLLKHAYEKHKGGYKHSGEKTKEQKNLQDWTSQNWETVDKSKVIKKNKTTRYLPHDVWESLTAEEKQQAIKTKEKGSKIKQHVSNPPSVKRKMRKSHGL
ncbi:MAG: hypothetical protein BGO77_03915 [Caedibacter sp. 37-49]|nr:MAG: hypothetical protein BGO77_03915 [Caedibacter sp. 37-49]